MKVGVELKKGVTMGSHRGISSAPRRELKILLVIAMPNLV